MAILRAAPRKITLARMSESRAGVTRKQNGQAKRE
jgi:hypothetical protein